MKRWLREPLLHFLLIGVVLFGVYAYVNRGRIGIESPRQIVLSLDELRTMTASRFIISKASRIKPAPRM
jgi:hypothetical protein